MTLRYQLAVRSPLSVGALAAGAAGAFGARDDADAVADEIATQIGASAVALADSGTSALVLAMRAVGGEGVPIALPAYGCIDLSAAAERAGIRALLYDLDPATLSPDLDSVARVLSRGARAIVVVHLFGLPADVPAVSRLAHAQGAIVIEDAAQGAGGRLGGKPLGALGDLGVLSFGRGKGTTGGGGGALVAGSEATRNVVRRIGDALRSTTRGWRTLATTAAQWAVGRPWLYGIPARIPALHLGEMVYHPAGEPAAISRASASILRMTRRLDAGEIAVRRANAKRLLVALATLDGFDPIRPIPEAEPGYLRLPVLCRAAELPRQLGVVRPYPSTLEEHAVLRPFLGFVDAIPGSTRLRDCLVAFPTHGLLSDGDLAAVTRWAADGSVEPTANRALAPSAPGSTRDQKHPALR